MSAAVDDLIREIRASFAARANPDVAEPQQAYMKSELPFYGLKAADVRKLMKPLLKQHTLRSEDEWQLAMRTL